MMKWDGQRGCDIDAHRRARRRALYAHSLRVEGKRYKVIGCEMGVGVERARQLVSTGQRILDRDYAHVGDACEIYISYYKKLCGRTLSLCGKFIKT